MDDKKSPMLFAHASKTPPHSNSHPCIAITVRTIRKHLPHVPFTNQTSLLSPTPLNASTNSKMRHPLHRLASHCLKACHNPSGISPFAPSRVKKTTKDCGMKGRSSAGATSMPYSCAKSSAARKEADFEERRCGGGERLWRVWMLCGKGCQQMIGLV